MKEIYLDNAATTKVDEKVAKAMQSYLTENYGNPSSLHFKGQEAKRGLDEAREIIAREIGAKFKDIIFTGSGTEANNFVIKGLFLKEQTIKSGKNHIITTKIEHDCILNACKWVVTQGGKVTYLDVDATGFVNPQDVADAITEKTILVSVIHGNNEIGTIQHLQEIGKICQEKNVLFHTDACQSFTKVPIKIKKMNLDLMTINAHKIHGPKGVGALYIREGIKITPLLHGGGQEFKLRSSTENVPGIVGFGKAVQVASNRDVKRIKKLRDYFIEKITNEISNVSLNGPSREDRLCNNINLCFNNIEGEAIGSFLNSAGIFTSTGSACSSKNLDPSHVLLAIGKTPLEANSSIRISISKYTTKEEIDFAIEQLKKTVEKLRRISPLVGDI
ncbi:cysteine desulfurase [archaeon]|jgi:cysteine desulfurase|nr:cysteine desulfurase [archaeon]MBT4373443.1 cysteine desulfurase [archaeon]MBT4531891.1 cysteine desulfurase [archaeon]MBT7001558.1 cysteine desulfurase [archaeon]MBT7282550.1 cysteine desulfurase [archaeon]